jgi:hypothetical protein
MLTTSQQPSQTSSNSIMNCIMNVINEKQFDESHLMIKQYGVFVRRFAGGAKFVLNRLAMYLTYPAQQHEPQSAAWTYIYASLEFTNYPWIRNSLLNPPPVQTSPRQIVEIVFPHDHSVLIIQRQ